jgi:hypothetical protein
MAFKSRFLLEFSTRGSRAGAESAIEAAQIHKKRILLVGGRSDTFVSF